MESLQLMLFLLAIIFGIFTWIMQIKASNRLKYLRDSKTITNHEIYFCSLFSFLFTGKHKQLHDVKFNKLRAMFLMPWAGFMLCLLTNIYIDVLY